jgi:hypothetical protein
MMIRAGYKPHEARRVWVAMNKWQSLTRKEVRVVLNVAWLRKQGLVFPDDFMRATLELPFGR